MRYARDKTKQPIKESLQSLFTMTEFNLKSQFIETEMHNFSYNIKINNISLAVEK